MASYHFIIKTDRKPDGTKVSASDHADYNNREGRFQDIDARREYQYQLEKDNQESKFKNERLSETIADSILPKEQTIASDHLDYINRNEQFAFKGGCVHQDHHLPKWANDSSKTFWKAATKYTSPVETVYREIEFALPNELTLEQQKEVVNEFVANHLGENFYWSLAIHEKEAAMGNGERNPHVHIMFSEKKLDDIEKNQERSPEIFFKKANREHREKGGPNKDSKWNGKDRAKNLVAMRLDCANIQNRLLEKYGYDVTVDHRTLVAQREDAIKRGDHVLAEILDRAPEQNIGPNYVYQFGTKKVASLKQYRQLKSEHQQLIIAADILSKSIAEDEITESVTKSFAQAGFVASEIKQHNLTDSEQLKTLSIEIINASRDLSVARSFVQSNTDIVAESRRNLMTNEELNLERKTKLIHEEKLTLIRQEKELNKPDPWDSIAFAEYKEKKQMIAERLSAINEETKEIASQLRMINTKFTSKDYKIKLKKEQKILLENNQAAKDIAESLHKKLDTLVLSTREIINKHITDKETFAEEEIAKELAIPLAEKEVLSQERAILASRKAKFEETPTPAFYYEEKLEIWKREKNDIDQGLREINIKEQQIEEKIQAIKIAHYEPKQIGSDLLQIKASINKLIDEEKQQKDYTTLTAKTAAEIINTELRSLKTELRRMDYAIEELRKNLITISRAEMIAKNAFVGGKFKEARAERADIKKEALRIEKAKEDYRALTFELSTIEKPKFYQTENLIAYNTKQANLIILSDNITKREAELATRTSENQKCFNDLEARCLIPIARINIQKGIDSILDSDKPNAIKMSDLVLKQISLKQQISDLTKKKVNLEKQAKYDAAESRKNKKIERRYKVPSSNISSDDKGQNKDLSASKILSALLPSDPKIVALMAYCGEDEIDLEGMTDEQKKSALAEIRRDQEL